MPASSSEHEIVIDGAIDNITVVLDRSSRVPLINQLLDPIEAHLTKEAGLMSDYSALRDRVDASTVSALIFGAVREVQEKLDARKARDDLSEGAPELSSFGEEVRLAFEGNFVEEAMARDDGFEALGDEVRSLAGRPDDIDEQIRAIAQEEGIELEREDIDGNLEGWSELIIEDAVTSADTYSIDDVIADAGGSIRLVYVAQSMPGAGHDDPPISFRKNYSTADGVVPDDQFQAFLDMINLSAWHYVREVARTCDVDLLDPEQSEDAEQWQELVEGHAPDLMRPPAVSPAGAIEIVENSYSWCNPTFVADVPIDVLMKLEKDSEMLIQGGQVGLHDFVNGAGHVMSPEGPLRLPGDLSLWFPENESIDDVYGMTKQAYEAEIKIYEESPQVSLPLAPEPGR